MITRQNPFAARTKSFLGRNALFRPYLPGVVAGTILFNGYAECDYAPVSVPATSRAGREVVVAQAPPEPLQEMATAAPGFGFVWIPGVWVWEDRWTWEGGHWARPPYRSAVWVSPRCVNRNGFRVFIRGGWR